MNVHIEESTKRGRAALHAAWLAVVVLVSGLACVGPRAAAAQGPAPGPALDGRYALDDRADQSVFVTRCGEGMYLVAVPGLWEGVALVDGREFWGAFHYPEQSRDRSLVNTGGTWKGAIDEGPTWRVHGEFTHGRNGKFDQTWVFREAAPPPADSLARPREERPRDSEAAKVTPAARGPALRDSTLPRPGEPVAVEQLPEPVTRMAPPYPDDARRRGISGTVVLQVLVGRDGRVVDAFVTQSVPGLDEAAVHCVEQWTFKPAMNAGKPVAVWVSIPVKFTLR